MKLSITTFIIPRREQQDDFGYQKPLSRQLKSMDLSKCMQLTNFMQVAVFLGPGIDTHGGPYSVPKDKELIMIYQHFKPRYPPTRFSLIQGRRCTLQQLWVLQQSDTRQEFGQLLICSFMQSHTLSSKGIFIQDWMKG